MDRLRRARPEQRLERKQDKHPDLIRTSTDEILRIIASSAGTTDPVFEAITRAAMRLVPGARVGLLLVRDGQLGYGSHTGISDKRRDEIANIFPMPLDRDMVSGAAILDRRIIHVPDIHDEATRYPGSMRVARLSGDRAFVCVPLMRGDTAIGTISVRRSRAGAFTAKQVSLLKTFADQAVIALENARLFNETKEALEQQTATVEILKVISASPTDVQPVFDAIVRSAVPLCDAESSNLQGFDGERMHLLAAHNFQSEAHAEFARIFPMRPERKWIGCRAVLDKSVVHIADLFEEQEFPTPLARKSGWRCVLAVPMLREGVPIGAIVVARTRPELFSEKQIALLRTFADQAVIAIENVRLFNETKEALERQTATAEILRVISSTTTDTQPVFEAIVESGLRVLPDTTLAIAVVKEDAVRVVATGGYLRGALGLAVPPGRESATGTAIADRRLVHLPDVEAPGVPPLARENGRRLGYRSMAVAPMLREDRVIGAISVLLRTTGGLSDKQLNLLQMFADQAVIAIENVRLFNETKEALKRQTATSEILKVIARSPTDMQPVLDTVAENAGRLCGAPQVFVLLKEGDLLRTRARYSSDDGPTPPSTHAFPVRRTYVTGRALLDTRTVHLEDVSTLLDSEFPDARGNQETYGFRGVLAVPMIRNGEGIGVLYAWRREPGLFAAEQVALLQTFADQAVIAIQNAQLFREIQERNIELKEALEQQTATSDILKVISRTTFDLQPVLEIVLSNARKLCQADRGIIFRPDDKGHYFPMAFAAPEDEGQNRFREIFNREPIKVDRSSATGRAIVDGVTVHIPDVLTDPEYKRSDIANAGKYRSILAVPMLRAGTPIGVLALSRVGEAKPFNEKQIELVTVFADQAVIAIENVRLFNEIQEKSGQLEVANTQLEIANKHKSEFLASMSHELRTPLNAILGFNEMILGQIYGEVPVDMKEPLEDIQKSGKHLLRLINNVLDLAKIEAGRMELVLSDYSVHDTVESVRSTLRPLAAEKGLEFVAHVPADIPLAYGDQGRLTQCLMNLAGNALKFTKTGKVEISVEGKGGVLVYRVSDTGMGIPQDKLDTVFSEFRQTDATIASEYGGTGLGLSISKKFIEMHGGRIWVESELGRGSTFIFEIPERMLQATAP